LCVMWFSLSAQGRKLHDVRAHTPQTSDVGLRNNGRPVC
jgi:hypothetical protein